MWKQQLNQLQNLQILGSGTFGIVYKLSYEGKYAALKEFKRSTENREIIEREIQMLYIVKHKNIVQLYDTAIVDDMVYMLMEYVGGGSLYRVLHGEPKIPVSFEDGLRWMYQAAEGLAYLHGMDPIVIHRDVKPLNMLIDKTNNTLKICDFGTVRYKRTFMTEDQGTALYIAPEACSGSQYNEKIDTYSMGITIWEVMARKIPFLSAKMNVMKLIKAVQKGLRPPLNELSKECPDSLKTLMEACWHHDPEKRPSMQELQNALGNIISNSFK